MTSITTFKPTGQRVLVQNITDKAQVGSILIPEAHREQRPQEATIVAIGPKARLDAKVGDRVITDAFAGQHIDVGGKMHRLLEPGDLLAVIG